MVLGVAMTRLKGLHCQTACHAALTDSSEPNKSSASPVLLSNLGYKVKHTCASVSVIVICYVIYVFRMIDVEIDSACSS